MSRSYSAFGWLCAWVVFLSALGAFAYHGNAHATATTCFMCAFIWALHIPQSYRNGRAKAAQARTAPMVRVK